MTKNKKSQKNNKTIVITGTSGFKGRQLLKKLEADPNYTKIVAVDYKKPDQKLKKAKFYKLDLTDTLADVTLAEILKKENCDTIVHCAFPITPPKNPQFAHELISVGTMYVLNAAAEARVKKFIMASTTDVYGAFPSNPNYLLEDIHEPKGDRQSLFLADKIDAEKQVLRFVKKNPETIVTILRFCTILGPTINSYKTKILRRFFAATMLGFDPLLQFIHEDDVTKAFIKAIESDTPGIFNIVGDGVLPLSRVIEMCGKLNLRLPQFGFKTIIQFLWFLDIAAAPASHVNFLRYLCVSDGTKAKQQMHFQPQFTTKEALLSFIGAERLRDVNLIKS